MFSWMNEALLLLSQFYCYATRHMMQLLCPGIETLTVVVSDNKA